PDSIFLYPALLLIGSTIVYIVILICGLLQRTPTSVETNLLPIPTNFYNNRQYFLLVFTLAIMVAHTLALIIHGAHSYWITLTVMVLIKPDQDITSSRI